MSAIHIYLAEKSICKCGFSLLDDHIIPGKQTDYYASPDRAVILTFICGGCGSFFETECWFIHEKSWPWGTSQAGFLPAKAFKVYEN